LASGPVWTCAENLAPTGIASPDYPACSAALRRLRYPGPQVTSGICINLLKPVGYVMHQQFNP